MLVGAQNHTNHVVRGGVHEDPMASMGSRRASLVRSFDDRLAFRHVEKQKQRTGVSHAHRVPTSGVRVRDRVVRLVFAHGRVRDDAGVRARHVPRVPRDPVALRRAPRGLRRQLRVERVLDARGQPVRTRLARRVSHRRHVRVRARRVPARPRPGASRDVGPLRRVVARRPRAQRRAHSEC